MGESSITGKVKAVIFNKPTMNSMEVNVGTVKSVVEFDGFVNSKVGIDDAAKDASSANGSVNVRNVLQGQQNEGRGQGHNLCP